MLDFHHLENDVDDLEKSDYFDSTFHLCVYNMLLQQVFTNKEK